VSAEWPLDDNEGAHGDAVLEIDIPESLFVEFEHVVEWESTPGGVVLQGGTYREAMIPASRLNEYPVHKLSDQEVDELTLKRWDSFGDFTGTGG
jgi:hypothetical protein